MELSKVSFASISIDSNTDADIVCGSNGLPLTPNSIRIIGNFKAHIEHVDHPNLVKYVDCFRNKDERVTLVFEDLSANPPDNLDFNQLAKQFLDSLNHIHEHICVVHGLIHPDCFVWDGQKFKLAHWAIHMLTKGGLYLNSSTILPPIISYLSPEQVKNPRSQATKASDLWSAGLCLLKLVKPSVKIPENPSRLAFCDTPDQVLDLVEGWLCDNTIENFDKWNNFFKKLLHPEPKFRASISELYATLELEPPEQNKNSPFTPLVPDHFEKVQKSIFHLNKSEIYHLWRLSIGRNFESEQLQDDHPPISKIPYLIVTEKQQSSSMPTEVPLPTIQQNKQDQQQETRTHILIDTKPKSIPLDKFKFDVDKLNVRIFYPLILTDEEVLTSERERRSHHSSNFSLLSKDSAFGYVNNNNNTANGAKNGDRRTSMVESFTFADLDNLSVKSNIQTQVRESSKVLPLVIKEADYAYQSERIVLFKRLVAGCPYLIDQLRREASVDIPPFMRAQVWAILLNVDPKKWEPLYEKIDKRTQLSTDRQISVDIPRCHQYNELMASPEGHQRLARILKTWLNHNSSEYVYWQGLDSLAAPFLLLNFHNEAMAFACFNAFVNKYLRGIFQKDNQLVVQQYLTMFSELLAYHDSSLATHLEHLGFLPNLYAIPWFLTMFTHVLPLHKILHVWDCLLLGDEKYPLCVGLAILNQLRSDLMSYTFNDCLAAFSDMPEIDIERCIREASLFYLTTPDKLINLTYNESDEASGAALLNGGK